jgi:RNA polymerase sigma-70 factor (ECF subfamily)
VQSLLAQGQPEAAINDIVRTLGPELRGYLRGTLGDDSEGDDVFQDISLALCERLPTFRFESSLRTFCYAIAHHRVVNRLKRYSRRHVVRMTSEQKDGLPTPSMTSLLEHQRQTNLVAAAAEQLTPAEREVLILRAERGLSFADIAAILADTNEAGARQRYHRAKDRLRELVRQAEQDDSLPLPIP